MTAALKITDLVYVYTSDWLRKRTPTLKGISLEVAAGESFGFLGHNGAGKTTTIKCILGLIRAAQGEISVFGTDPSRPAGRKSIGYLPEQPYFYDQLTVGELLELYAHLAGVEHRRVKVAVGEALDAVKMTGRIKSRLRSLSKGLTQRVALAQAIVARPKLLILDEPFSGLDPIGRKEFRDLFVRLKADGTTIFMSSHILGDVQYLCDRVSIMAHGELKGVFDRAKITELCGGSFELTLPHKHAAESALASLGAETTVQEGLIRYAFKDKAAAGQALQLAVQAGVKIESYQHVQGNLEELFMRLVNFDEGR